MLKEGTVNGSPVKLTDIMMWLEILMDFDVDSLLGGGECNYYLDGKQNQGHKIQRRGHQAQGEDSSWRVCVVQQSQSVSRIQNV